MRTTESAELIESHSPSLPLSLSLARCRETGWKVNNSSVAETFYEPDLSLNWPSALRLGTRPIMQTDVHLEIDFLLHVIAQACQQISRRCLLTGQQHSQETDQPFTWNPQQHATVRFTVTVLCCNRMLQREVQLWCREIWQLPYTCLL